MKTIFTEGSSALVLYRISRFLRKYKLGFIGWIFSELNRIINGCSISSRSVFGKDFVLKHPIGVVIEEGVVCGDNVVFESGVVVGSTHSGSSDEIPVLGDNVFVGSGAKILGAVKIGSNVKIGANAVVVKDVCDGATVVGIPGRIINLDTENKEQE